MPGTDNNLYVYSFEPFGYEGALLSVETDLRQGIPSVDIVGLADGSVKSARERLIAAFRNQGLEFPSERVLMSLSPAYLRKESSCTDLAMAVSILNEQNKYYRKPLPVLVMGELDVNGTVRPVEGVVAAVQEAKSLGITNIIVPDANMNEALSVGGVKVLPVSNLSEVHEKLLDFDKSFVIESQNEPISNSVTFDEEKIDELLERDFNKALEGHYNSARAIEVAIAGKHNILLTGAPGCGKTMLSQRLIPALTPNLTQQESQSTTRIWSIAGLVKPNEGLKKEVPLRMPHQTASIEGICGGGVNCRPGEISLAHNGVLFLDEAAEFRSSVLQMMRVPLENKSIALSRAGRTTIYPSNFQLVMATNPCPCGNYGSKDKICLDSQKSIELYWKKFSTPLLDRVEIKQFVAKDVNDNRKITVEEMKQHILNAMTIQRNNQNYNSNLTPQEIAEKCKLDEKSQKYFDNEFSDKSERSKANSLKLALTIANMDNRTEIEFKDLREAVELNKSIFEKELNFNSEIEPDYNSKSENKHTLSEDEFQDYSVDNEVFKYNNIFNEAVRDSYYDGIAINRIVEYHPEDYGFEKDDKLHLIVEYDNNEISYYEEDGLFNCLNDKHIEFNGKEIDWNPIDTAIHGTAEKYLEYLKLINETKNLNKNIEPKFYYIGFYNDGETGYVSEENKPTINLDSTMKFKTEKEAQVKREELQKQWGSTLKVEPYFELQELEKKEQEKSKYTIDLRNTGYFDDGILTIDVSKKDNTEFAITAFDKTENQRVTKDFDFSTIFNEKYNSLDILSQPMKVTVNEKERECKNGILAGFKTAVEKLDNLTRDYNSLVDNYSILKEQNATLSNQLESIKENQEKKHDLRDYTAR